MIPRIRGRFDLTPAEETSEDDPVFDPNPETDPTEEIPNDPFEESQEIIETKFAIQTNMGLIGSGENLAIRKGNLVVQGSGFDGNFDYGTF